MSKGTPRREPSNGRGSPRRMKVARATSRSLEGASEAQLWKQFESTALQLTALANSAPQTVNCDRLSVAMAAGLRMLTANSELGGETADHALTALFNVTSHGCRRLALALANEQSRHALLVLASLSPEWPVMLSPRTDSSELAKWYLNIIGVGTRSFPPTGKTKIDAENPWTNLAVMLLKKILRSLGYLKIEKRELRMGEWAGNHLYQSREFLQTELPEARKWKHVLDLPPNLNKETRAKWWGVAKEMLKDHLKANPRQAARHFNQVKTTADDEGKSPQTIVIRSVREAFYAIVTRTSSATN